MNNSHTTKYGVEVILETPPGTTPAPILYFIFVGDGLVRGQRHYHILGIKPAGENGEGEFTAGDDKQSVLALVKKWHPGAKSIQIVETALAKPFPWKENK